MEITCHSLYGLNFYFSLCRKTGKCGVCGDAVLDGNHDDNKKSNGFISGYHDAYSILGNHDIITRPGDHETGGRYAKGIISRIYNKVSKKLRLMIFKNDTLKHI